MSVPASPLLSGYSPAVTVHTTTDLPAEPHWAFRFPLYPETIREYLFPIFGGPADFHRFHCMVNSFAYDRMSHEVASITPYFIRDAFNTIKTRQDIIKLNCQLALSTTKTIFCTILYVKNIFIGSQSGIQE